MFRDFSNMSKPTILKNSSWSQIIFLNPNVESEQHKECKIAEKAYPLLTELDLTKCLIQYILLPYLTCNNGSNSLFDGKTSLFQAGTVSKEAGLNNCPFSRNIR